jgi:hemolysin activation/secretion protein
VDDRIRKVRAELLTVDHQDVNGRTVFGLGVHQGLGQAMGGMENNSVLSSRAYGRADNSFTKVTASLARAQNVTNRIALIGRFSGQYAEDSIVAGEQWSIGGPDSVHGHESGVYLGDDGYTANLESRVTVLSTAKSKYQLLAFGDYGAIRTKHPTISQKKSNHIAGTGLGFYADVNGAFDVRADYGVPVGTKTGSGNPLITFEVKYKF